MGNTSYSVSDRTLRAESKAYFTADINTIFEQNKKREIHKSMNPKGAVIREARDSETHPNTVPIILALDVTGSMGHIPHHMIKDGLPTLMGGLVQKGCPDPALLFLAVGDGEVDRFPLQVGQFESGDAELDMWLTRTYLEGGGGGNKGESYLLAWYFAALHTVTDSFEKRKKKGFLFTVGDEPCLSNLPVTQIKEIMGLSAQVGYSDKELLEMAQQTYNVYHLHIMEGSAGIRSISYWKELLNDNCIQVDNHSDVSKIIADIVLKGHEETPIFKTPEKESSQEEEML